MLDRRSFLAAGTATAMMASIARNAAGVNSLVNNQDAGERPFQDALVKVLNPRGRVPVSWIIDDSTCLVNLNRFAMPQFDAAFGGKNQSFHQPWKQWPVEIPDDFVRKFIDWCDEHGVKGKYSIVPFPACVGRLDRELPGWSRRELEASIALVRERVMKNWDIHPEMVTHTRVIDLKTGHPYDDVSLKFMENWEWSVGRSADELTEYFAYALKILRNIGMPCEGVTTPGGFCNRARPQLAQATFESLRDVFQTEIPHYFRDLFDEGEKSVAPIVQNASGLKSDDPRCVVHTIGCTGDWTGGWDCVEPDGVDRFISADGRRGRLVEVIERGEPAVMVCHWTGIYWNGLEKGFQVLQEVVTRLKQHYDHLHWMKLSEIARYWAAKELTEVKLKGDEVHVDAPYACNDFTLTWPAKEYGRLSLSSRVATDAGDRDAIPLRRVFEERSLESGCWLYLNGMVTACFDLPKRVSVVAGT